MTKYIRKKDSIDGRLHDELIMMDIDQGKYFALNPVATRIWDLLENPASLDEICTILMNEYEVDATQCHEEVQTHMEEMVNMKLVKV